MTYVGVDAEGRVDPEAVGARAAARHGARLDHGRQRRDRHPAARARDRPARPAPRRAVPRRRRRRRRAAAAHRGRVRDRPAHAVVERSLRAAGRRRALGAAGRQAGAASSGRRAGGRLPRGHREPAGHRRHGRGRRPGARRARRRGRAPAAAARPPARRPARARRRRAAHRRPRRRRAAASRVSIVVPGVKADAVLLELDLRGRGRLLGLGLHLDRPASRRTCCARSAATREECRGLALLHARAAGRPRPRSTLCSTSVPGVVARFGASRLRRSGAPLPVRHRRHAGDRARRRPRRASPARCAATYGTAGADRRLRLPRQDRPADRVRPHARRRARRRRGSAARLDDCFAAYVARAGARSSATARACRCCRASPRWSARLAARDDALVGLLTGNIERGRPRQARADRPAGRSSGWAPSAPTTSTAAACPRSPASGPARPSATPSRSTA